jgi:hypothetical protein
MDDDDDDDYHKRRGILAEVNKYQVLKTGSLHGLAPSKTFLGLNSTISEM